MAYLTLSFKKMINIPNKNPLAVLEDEKLKQIRKLERMENEMQAMFTKKLNLKLEKIRNFLTEKSAKLCYTKNGNSRGVYSAEGCQLATQLKITRNFHHLIITKKDAPG